MSTLYVKVRTVYSSFCMATRSDRQNRGRPRLSRQQILHRAIELADADGVDKLSMRKLAAALGFEVMSLYNHVANKKDLLIGMVDQVATEIDCPDGPWREAMRTSSLSTKAMFEQHPWAALLWLTTNAGPARIDLAEWQLATLAAADLSESDAHNAFHAINNHVVGYMVQATVMNFEDEERIVAEFKAKLDPERHKHMIEHVDQHLRGDQGPSFEYVLDIIIDAIAGAGRTGER